MYFYLHTTLSQACCSIFNNDGYWYRSEIVSITSFDVVEVLYVDYGNSSQVPLAAIRRPKPHYLILPAQSINCRLANLKPAGSVSSCLVTSYVIMTIRGPRTCMCINATVGLFLVLRLETPARMYVYCCVCFG